MSGPESFESQLAATVADLDRLVRRLRAISPRAWKDRRAPAQAALDGLVALDAALEGRQLESPSVPDHVLPDAIALIGGDVLAAIAATRNLGALDELGQVLGEALAGTR